MMFLKKLSSAEMTENQRMKCAFIALPPVAIVPIFVIVYIITVSHMDENGVPRGRAASSDVVWLHLIVIIFKIFCAFFICPLVIVLLISAFKCLVSKYRKVRSLGNNDADNRTESAIEFGLPDYSTPSPEVSFDVSDGSFAPCYGNGLMLRVPPEFNMNIPYGHLPPPPIIFDPPPSYDIAIISSRKSSDCYSANSETVINIEDHNRDNNQDHNRDLDEQNGQQSGHPYDIDPPSYDDSLKMMMVAEQLHQKQLHRRSLAVQSYQFHYGQRNYGYFDVEDELDDEGLDWTDYDYLGIDNLFHHFYGSEELVDGNNNANHTSNNANHTSNITNNTLNSNTVQE